MPVLSRRGMTLIELLIALVLMGIVSAALVKALQTHQRTYAAQTQKIVLQENIRAGATILPADFRELDATDGDIISMTSTSLTVRAMRQMSFLCSEPVLGGANTTLIMRNTPRYMVRASNAATDSLLVYYEGDEATRIDDGWVTGPAAAEVATVCPDGNRGFLMLTKLAFAGPPNSINQTGRIQSGAPVRTFVPVTYSLYTAADGRAYVGYDEGSGAQPLIGPLLSNGLAFVYYDSTGVVTNQRQRVARIEIHLRAETDQAVRRPDGSLGRMVDSVTTVVSLRNNRRF